MAKKFAQIIGLHKIYETYNNLNNGVITTHYNLKKLIANDLVNKNTVAFVRPDYTDAGRIVSGHKIDTNDRYIIVQNDVYAIFNKNLNSSVEDVAVEFRPILINDADVTSMVFDTSTTDENSEITPNPDFSLNIENSEYLSIKSDYNLNANKFSIKYDLDTERLLDYIQNNIKITLPDIEDAVYNGSLTFATPDEPVFTTNNGENTQILINQNTISVEGSFSANAKDNSTVNINYKGTADRVDWYISNEQRTQNDKNDSNAKKFVYIDCLQNYFDSSSESPYLILSEEGKKIISEDSIVFITCGKIKQTTPNGIFEMTDAEAFNNPEYAPGARFIWTHNKMFSANTWMPIFTRQTEAYNLKNLTPVIGNSPHGGRLILEGKGGVIVDNSKDGSDVIITIDGSGITKGEIGEGISLENGKATKVVDLIDGKKIDIVAKKGPIDTIDYFDKTHKNFIQIKEQETQDGKTESWIEVNGVDTKSIFVEEEIPIAGTIIANQIIESRSFSDYGDKIPAGMSLHEVLKRILFRENSYPGEGYELSINYDLSVKDNNITISAWYYDEATQDKKGDAIANNAILPVNTKIIVEVSASSIPVQTLSLDHCDYGCITDPELVIGESVTDIVLENNIYKEIYSPSQENTLNIEPSAFDVISNVNNKLVLVVKYAENNIVTCSNVVTPIGDERFIEHTIYQKSDMDKTSEDFSWIAQESGFNANINTANNMFKINPIYPYFIGVVKPKASGDNYFNFENASNNAVKQFIMSNLQSSIESNTDLGFIQYNEQVPSSMQIFTPNEWFDINENNTQGPSQIIIIMPKTSFNSNATINNWIKITDDLNTDVTDLTAPNIYNYFGEIALFGQENDYFIYTKYNALNEYGIGGTSYNYTLKNLK